MRFCKRVWQAGVALPPLLAVLVACGDSLAPPTASDPRPNVLLIVADDMGFSDAGAFGGEIATPNIDSLAGAGIMFTEFHVAPNCGPTRGSLLTGVDFHRAGMGGNPEVAADNQKGLPAYQGHLRDDVVSVAELLQEAGYHTSMAGKWHLGADARNLPGGRGFGRSFALLNGGASHWADQAALIPGSRTRYTEDDQPIDTLPSDFYSTTAYTERVIEYIEEGVADDRPFFTYLSYTAPHNPLHAPDEAIQKYRGRYDAGWDALAAERADSLRQRGLLGESQTPSPRPQWVQAWEELTAEQQAGRSRDMEVYAGMIDYLDQSIGRVLQHLRDIGEYDNTLIVFMSDNGPSKTAILDYIALGGAAEEFFGQFDNALENRGRPGSSTDIGPGWAFASATPLRLFKGYVAQGGIRVPLIVKPVGASDTPLTVETPVHVMDLAPTILELAGVAPPTQWKGSDVAAVEGQSLLPLIEGKTDPGWMERGLGWEAYGMDAFRRGEWKILRLPEPYGNGLWQLYHLADDPGETDDLAEQYPERVQELAADWDEYAATHEVVHPDVPVAYARPVSAGRY
jgi:arylsulfatase